MRQASVEIALDGDRLTGDLTIPDQPRGLVLFAHGSGSSRLSPRNRFVARVLNDGGLGTLLVDLLTLSEERIDAITGELRFDIEFLARRLMTIMANLEEHQLVDSLRLGLFGSSTGAAAALVAAAASPGRVSAVVSRGGRPDLAGDALPEVRAPSLLIVGSHDPLVLDLNRRAFAVLRCEKELAIVPGATHLFEEPGTLEQAARLAQRWFLDHLQPAVQPEAGQP
jgi:putative phosphoribosyl transferase